MNCVAYCENWLLWLSHIDSISWRGMAKADLGYMSFGEAIEKSSMLRFGRGRKLGCIVFVKAIEKWSTQRLLCNQMISGSLNYLMGALKGIKSG